MTVDPFDRLHVLGDVEPTCSRTHDSSPASRARISPPSPHPPTTSRSSTSPNGVAR